MIIKYASKEDVEAISAVERECFPPSEAATEKEFVERVKHYGNHFWLMYEAEKLIAFVDGFVTDEYDLTDEMYENAAMHNEKGAWQMIFGVNTLPEYRKHGYAAQLICRAVDDAKHLRQRDELGGERFCAVKCVLRDFRAAEGLEIFRDIGTDLFDRQVDFQIGKNTV